MNRRYGIDDPPRVTAEDLIDFLYAVGTVLLFILIVAGMTIRD